MSQILLAHQLVCMEDEERGEERKRVRKEESAEKKELGNTEDMLRTSKIYLPPPIFYKKKHRKIKRKTKYKKHKRKRKTKRR